MPKRYKEHTEGFSLIEMLIVLMIMVTFFGLGYANYRDFQRRQTLEAVRQNIIKDLIQASGNAASGVKPAGCGVLKHYSFSRTSATSYQISGVCANASYPIKTVNMPQGITIASGTGPPATPNPIIFKILGNGTNISPFCGSATCPSIILTQTASGNTANIFVSSTGTIR